MKSISQHILEKLKVSSNNINDIPFEDFAFALYKYCNKHDVTELRLYSILDFKYKTIEQYPYFEKPMITKCTICIIIIASLVFVAYLIGSK